MFEQLFQDEEKNVILADEQQIIEDRRLEEKRQKDLEQNEKIHKQRKKEQENERRKELEEKAEMAKQKKEAEEKARQEEERREKIKNELIADPSKLKELRQRAVKFAPPANDRQAAVVGMLQHAWTGYTKYAWGHDHLRPITQTHHDWFGLGLTIVDGLDTLWILGLTDG